METAPMSIMEQTKLFNNNGVQFLAAGYLEEAKDLFRAALENKLAYDRAKAEGCAERNTRCVTPECIFVAEYHIINRSKYFSRPRKRPGSLMSLVLGSFSTAASAATSNKNKEAKPSAATTTTGFGSRTTGTASFVSSSDSETSQSLPPQHHNAITELLYAQAFPIRESDSDSFEYMNAINIFNLGLVHQLEDKSSTKARAYYEVSASLLSSEPWDTRSALLRAALMNNFGIFAYQNNEFEAALDSFEQLSRMMASWPGEPEQAAGFQSNLAILDILDGEDEDDEGESEMEDNALALTG